jgi:RING-H2 zinc finger domain
MNKTRRVSNALSQRNPKNPKNMPREATEENDFVITFSFFLPPDDGRQPSELLQLFTENAQMIASVAVQRWLNPVETLPRASNDAINNLPEFHPVLSEKRRNKHQLCAVCQEEFLKPSEEGMKDRNQERITRLPCHHIYHKTCLRSWLETACNCPHCRYEVI